jgi:hypothetical protein
MKVITLSATALMLLGTLTLGMADEISVDEQITAIQEAPAQERVQLMNQFKERLATMNADEREAAITQLRTQTQTQTQARLQDGTAEGEQIQTRTMTKERSRINEMQQTQQQQMQQQQMQKQQQMQQMQQQMQQQIDSAGTSVPTPVAGQ